MLGTLIFKQLYDAIYLLDGDRKILSVPLKTLDGSESAVWGPPWFPACSS